MTWGSFPSHPINLIGLGNEAVVIKVVICNPYVNEQLYTASF